jgi:plastocyanin
MRACGAISAALTLLAAAVLVPAGAAARTSSTTAVGVSEREFRISVYRTSVAPGPVRFNVTNFGEDAHDLAVFAPGGRLLALSPEIRSERRHTLAVRLARPGVYRLVCTKLDHAARGMRTTVRVRRPPAKPRKSR